MCALQYISKSKIPLCNTLYGDPTHFPAPEDPRHPAPTCVSTFLGNHYQRDEDDEDDHYHPDRDEEDEDDHFHLDRDEDDGNDDGAGDGLGKGPGTHIIKPAATCVPPFGAIITILREDEGEEDADSTFEYFHEECST